MQALRFILPLLFGLALLGSTSCKKDDPEKEGLSYVNGVPYYHFTEADRPWLQAKEGEVWKLVNGRGYQREYRVQVIQRIRAPYNSTSSGIPGTIKLLSYYDQITIRIGRTDSARTYLDLRFYRDAAMLTNLISGGVDPNTSRFYAEGEDHEFVGNTDLVSDYYSCRGLKFPSRAALYGPFPVLTVRGRTYPDVVAFIGAPRGPNCAPAPPYFMQELYYDRQAGLIRMVSIAGEVWDRVP